MSTTDELVANAKRYAEGFGEGHELGPPSKRVAVVACMDARLIPSRILGLQEGEAHILRNAGGIVTDDVIRSLSLSQHLLGTEEVVLLHHTDCGMLTFEDEAFAGKLEEETGRRPGWHPGAFRDVEQDVRDSIMRIRESPFIPRSDSVRGFVFDVESGELREVT